MSNEESTVSTDDSTDGEVEAEGKRECFVIAPVGSPRSETRRQTDGLLDEAIRPVVEEKLGLNVVAAHELPEAGSITRQVIQRLLEAELVVADLTNLNPNVMYELAVRHSKGKAVVPIAEESTNLPFDITTERTIFYEESFHGLNKLKPEPDKAVRAALRDKDPDNPIYRAQQDFQMRKAVAGDEVLEQIVDRLDGIESNIGKDDDRSFTQEDMMDELERENNKLQDELESRTDEVHRLRSRLRALENKIDSE